MDKQELIKGIRERMSEHRFRHTMGVAETAVKLADIFKANPQKAELAGLLHDIAREYSPEQILTTCREYGIRIDDVEEAVPDLLHGKLAAHMAAESYGVNDSEILQAVSFHTTGHKNMSLLDKIIFIADMIEPGRVYPGVDSLRKMAHQDLNRAVLLGLESTIRYVLERGLIIHPDSIEARNSLLKPV